MRSVLAWFSRSLLVVVLCGVACSVAPEVASAGVQVGVGSSPGVAVDASGVGHVAWHASTKAGDTTNSFIDYCRVPAGAGACDKLVQFPTPSNATTFGETQVLVDGARVIVLSEVASSPSGVWAWISPDGGASFTAATVPKRISNDLDVVHAVLFGPGSNQVAMVSGAVGGGVSFVAGDLTGNNPGTAFPIGAADGLNYRPYADVGMLNALTPYVVLSGGSNVYLKVFDSTKSGYDTAGSWKPAVIVDGGDYAAASSPRTTSGLSSAFLTYETNTSPDGGYGIKMRRISDDGSVGPLQRVTPDGANPYFSAITQDAAGRLHLVYPDHDRGTLVYQWSKRGVTFSDPADVSAPGEDHGYDPVVAAAPDGSGLAVVDGNSSNSAIRVFPLPGGPKGDADPVPTPKTTPSPVGPKTATPAPVLPPACPAQIQVSPLVKAMVRTGACFTKNKAGTVYTTTGSVRVNGIDFSAPASGTFTVDTVAHTITADGAYKTTVGSIVLAQGKLTWDVTKPNTIPDLSAFGVKLFGLGVDGKADVAFEATGAAVTINVTLPSPFDAAHGRTTLHTTMAGGLATTDVEVRADTIPMGPLEFRNLRVAYTGASDALEGHVDVYLPPSGKAGINAGFGLLGGNFAHAEVTIHAGVPPLPLPLFGTPPVILNEVSLFAKDNDKGFTMGGNVKLDAGADIAGFAPVGIDGNATFFIPKAGGHAVIDINGKITILDIPVASGFVKLDTSGPLTFGGSADVDLAFISVNVGMGGGIDLSNGDFYANGKASACLTIGTEVCGEIKAVLSSIGIAACGAIGPYEGGYDRRWGKSSHLGSCRYDDYIPATLKGSGAKAPVAGAARAGGAGRLQVAAGAQTITLGGGDERGVQVHGSGSRPGFTFAGPGGRTITVPAGSATPVPGPNVYAVPVGPDTVELQVHQPAGTWTLTPAAGSTITSVDTAEELPTPKASARVKKTKTGRTVTVKAGDLGPQTLTVRELLPGGAAHELGTVRTAGTKVLKFTPADGPAGKRIIDAIVTTKSGRQVASPQIGSYVAPPTAKLPAPRTVTLTRTSGSIGVRWKTVPRADHYRVTITANDGRLQILSIPGKTTRATVPEVTSDDDAKITVAAISKTGLAGKTGAARSTPVKTKKARKTKRHR